MINCILVKYGEIAIRGKNREKYERMLIEQIKKTLGLGYYVKREQGRFLVECPEIEIDVEYAISKITKVPGVHSVCPCIKVETRDLNQIYEYSLSFVKRFYSDKNYTFKVHTKRADKQYPLTSDIISAKVGEYLLTSCTNLTVNVKNPDFIIKIELRNFVYIYSSETKGYGGLPVSSSGSALYLLSGGIDSPIAAFQMGKRGVYGEFIYFHSPPYVSALAKQKVVDLAEKVAEYIGETKLHIVPFTEVQEYLRENVPEDKLTVFLKRGMLSIAEMAAKRERMMALVVGDSVGQVASQTLSAINAIDSAADMPVLRPLAGANKQETIDIAKDIGTFDISILPYEDCCTIFTPKHPETRPKRSVIEAIERSLTDLEALKIEAFEQIETIKIGEAHIEGD